MLSKCCKTYLWTFIWTKKKKKRKKLATSVASVDALSANILANNFKRKHVLWRAQLSSSCIFKKYLSICLTSSFKLHWFSKGFKHVLKILLMITYVKEFTILCPEVRPHALTAIQDQLINGNLHSQITVVLIKSLH